MIYKTYSGIPVNIERFVKYRLLLKTRWSICESLKLSLAHNNISKILYGYLLLRLNFDSHKTNISETLHCPRVVEMERSDLSPKLNSFFETPIIRFNVPVYSSPLPFLAETVRLRKAAGLKAYKGLN